MADFDRNRLLAEIAVDKALLEDDMAERERMEGPRATTDWTRFTSVSQMSTKEFSDYVDAGHPPLGPTPAIIRKVTMNPPPSKPKTPTVPKAPPQRATAAMLDSLASGVAIVVEELRREHAAEVAVLRGQIAELRELVVRSLGASDGARQVDLLPQIKLNVHDRH